MSRYDPEHITSDHRALWERLVGEVSPIFTRLYMFPYRFLPPDGSPATTDYPRLLRMNMGSWRHWLLRSYQERLAFRKASTDLLQLITSVDTRNHPLLKSGTRERRESHYLHFECIAATENFHIALKLLLDRVALTVPWYFGETLEGARQGSHHRMLQERIHGLHHRIGGTEMPRQLTDLMQSLYKRVVEFRNVEIEHPTDPGDGFTTSLDWKPGDHRYIRMFSVRVADPFEDPKPLEDPDVLVRGVEEYIGLILDYLERYETKSVLRRCPGA
jgi:hypothetical protein